MLLYCDCVRQFGIGIGIQTTTTTKIPSEPNEADCCIGRKNN